ncbi:MULTISPECIES: flagellar basal body-associated protein FliL [Enterobacteriaceae]|uniref:flagellar basal body-associated protein FliL n=1 Tax=Enterobacteriaceae TaxID=543 RepID=UPI0015DD08FD|nr:MULTISPECIES: flagellar basal body-associated protein FliL [unclassified Klebsiella]HAT3951967.1 flagellar basal body-associated protein FliL [Kluyvera ascorbata]BBR59443.1 flagellar basal body-associated protein FliL [Klebsiella sp. WP4-W18-ESBL-05]BBS91219.1 flagellar basal body-associated protein FliL [Klebsiella sp. WP7-S18-CRE-02]BBS96241.1 flagellar basal body-associated protein FliL [Klebsiella sp. WP7-S18-CRE-03]BBT01273.1 flagellar basal body-associated protein FliL [Klebsiella sp.
MTDTAINKKSKRSLWIPLLVLVTLAACATAGYSYWRIEHQSATAAAPKEAPPPPAPVFFPLDTFTVNLGDADRVLYVGVTLRMKTEADRARLNDYLPEVRSRMLLLLSRQDATKLATDDGKKQLANDIKETLSAPLIASQPKQDITDVLYTAFILR